MLKQARLVVLLAGIGWLLGGLLLLRPGGLQGSLAGLRPLGLESSGVLLGSPPLGLGGRGAGRLGLPLLGGLGRPLRGLQHSMAAQAQHSMAG